MARTTSKDAQDEVDAMFDETGAPQDDDFAGIDDLLNEVEEDDSEGWVPSEVGEGIAGKIVKISTTRSDFAKDGEDADCPTWTVETRDGKFRVIGYGAVLKREMIDKNAKVGDLVGIKYFGEKLIKKGRYAGKPYKHFGIAIKRA